LWSIGPRGQLSLFNQGLEFLVSIDDHVLWTSTLTLREVLLLVFCSRGPYRKSIWGLLGLLPNSLKITGLKSLAARLLGQYVGDDRFGLPSISDVIFLKTVSLREFPVRIKTLLNDFL